LKVYDLLGKEVSVLINEAKEPGNYEVNFDASRRGRDIGEHPVRGRDIGETGFIFRQITVLTGTPEIMVY